MIHRSLARLRRIFPAPDRGSAAHRGVARRFPAETVALAIAAVSCAGAPRPIALAFGKPADAEAMSLEYRAWLDEGRTPARAVAFARARATDWRTIDPIEGELVPVRAGDRLVFVNRDRLALFVIVGSRPLLDAGARLIGTHIDTPAPRVSLANLSARGQTQITARSYGGLKSFQWLYRPLALVGTVVKEGGERIDVELGLSDDFALVATRMGGEGELTVVASSTPTSARKGAAAPATLVSTLHKRYGVDARDLEASELYLVPKQRAREVGVDRSMIGAHGQDDRVNSYAAWRAIADLPGTPAATAIVMLVDREEVGSTGKSGARSLFLEAVFAYLVRAQGSPATEATIARALSRTIALSADTPACYDPIWPEVHESKHAPLIGRGPAMFPFTGRNGKQGGSGAHAELVGSVLRAFERAGVPLQPGQLGRVDEGGGGTIAKYLGHRGIDAVDVGICVLSMHSPLELSSKHDVWSGYLGYRAWLEDKQ